MKKKVFVLMTGLCLLLALAGCGHEHSYTWKADAEYHWQVCAECGEETEKEAHVFGEDEICTGCNGMVYDNGDDTHTVTLFNEYGDMQLQLDYDAEGKIYFSQRLEDTYDENNLMESRKIYIFDSAYDEEGTERLESEEHYLPCENPDHGDIYLAESIYYDQDGGKNVYESNELSYITKMTSYDADGNVTYEEVHELEFNDNEICTLEKIYVNGNLDAEYHYDEEGNAVEIDSEER